MEYIILVLTCDGGNSILLVFFCVPQTYVINYLSGKNGRHRRTKMQRRIAEVCVYEGNTNF